jgi:hypothetical protein
VECVLLENQRDEAAAQADVPVDPNNLFHISHVKPGVPLEPPSSLFKLSNKFFGSPGDRYFLADTQNRITYHRLALEKLMGD